MDVDAENRSQAVETGSEKRSPALEGPQIAQFSVHLPEDDEPIEIVDIYFLIGSTNFN